MSDGQEKTPGSSGGGERLTPGYMPQIKEADTLNFPPIPFRPSQDGDSGSTGPGSGESAEQ